MPPSSLDLSPALAKALGAVPPRDRDTFALRLARSRRDLERPLRRLYGHLADFDGFLDRLLVVLATSFAARPEALRLQDLRRDLEPDWFQRETQVGYVFYVDRFAGSLRGVLDHLDYLEALGVTYVHFMPCLMPRPGDSDGGYSVMDYRRIDPGIGTMEDFEAVTEALRERGISVCIDLVLNHTAKEHAWAKAAQAGDPHHLAFYRTYRDRRMPDAFEETLLEVFPDTAPGNFTYQPDMGDDGLWVWTTFNAHQWDLDWENPDVFLAIAETMLFLANRGAEVLRFDAVAFLWKQLGTTCQNLPPVHDILAALRASSRIAAAALIHKEEAIVAPRDLIPYLGTGEHAGLEGNLAYHNTLMVQFWSMLASRETELATHVLDAHFPPRLQNAAWATYIRCHDDIGWAITEEDAAAVGRDGPAHRRFLSDFYAGDFPGSFARGGLFQVNEETGDARNNGATASLCGLETAREAGDEAGIAAAIDRILLGHALICAYGGIPLVYMGDELGLTNDPSFSADPAKAHDTRWMHRPAMDWTRAALRHDPSTIEGRVFAGVAHILHRRKATPHLHADNPVEILRGAPPGILAFRRLGPLGALIALFNASDDWRHVPDGWLREASQDPGFQPFDQLSEAPVAMPHGTLDLPPRGRVWLV